MRGLFPRVQRKYQASSIIFTNIITFSCNSCTHGKKKKKKKKERKEKKEKHARVDVIMNSASEDGGVHAGLCH